MIVSLTGEIQYYGLGYLVMNVGHVGYKILIPESAMSFFSGRTTIFTHEVMRESERELFGFLSMDALELFWKLISVSGVGPKIAQKIVCATEIEDVKAHITKGDLAFLTHVPGVGKKTAQKIVLELKGVLLDEPTFSSVDQDAIDALVGLGYSKKDAQQALSGIDEASTEDRIRIALKSLAR